MNQKHNLFFQLQGRAEPASRRGEALWLLMLAAATGFLAGYGAILFKLMILFTQKMFYGTSHDINTFVDTFPAFLLVLIPAVGGLLAGLIVYFGAREAKGHGVPEVMEAVALRDGVIRKRVAAIKILASAITIGTGGSAGREGPIVQIGAGIGSTIAQFFKTNSFERKTLVGCGAAAGIAATFNAPVAGVLFAIEVIMGELKIAALTPVVLSAVVATSLSRIHLGDTHIFLLPTFNLISYWEYLLFALLGVFCSFLSLLYMKSMVYSEHLFESLPVLPDYLKPALGGLMVGILLLMFPWVFGAGYGSINLALNGHLSIWVLLGLIFIKPLATSITLGSGGSGGSFTPALFIGAVGGGFFGSFFGKIFPVLAANASGYAMVGMGALIAGTIYAPITAIIMVFELSANYQIILPLMLCCLICSQLTSTIQKTSIYTHRLSQKGIDLAGGINQNILKNIPVSRQMKRSQATVLESASLGEVMKAFKAKNRPFLYVLDDQDTLQGHISFADILQYLDAQSQIPLTTAGEFANKNLYYVFSEDDLVAAMQLITETGYTELPVLDDSHSFKYLGVIREQDIYVAYQNVLQKKMITHQE